MSDKKYLIAVDFDGTLCEYKFPEIGEQTQYQKLLLNLLISLRKSGHKIILWTNRGDNDRYKCLTEAVEWCRNQGLEFDYINKNDPDREKNKLSGSSPKIMADFYIDDKALEFGTETARINTIDKLLQL